MNLVEMALARFGFPLTVSNAAFMHMPVPR